MPFNNPIVGGTQLVRSAIQSQGFQTGVTGWTINRDGSAEFNSALIRGELDLGPATPSPRVAVNPNIPPALSGWSVNVIFNVVFLWYYNAVDYFWQGIGTFSGTKVYMEGTYDTVNGPYVIRRTLQPAGAGVEETRIGSYLLDAFQQTHTYQQTRVRIGDGSNIGDALVVNGTHVSNSIVFNKDGSGTPETWQALVYSNGWANNGGTNVHGSYQKVASPPNSVQLVGAFTPGTKVDGTALATLPAAYWPISGFDLPVVCNITPAAGGQSPHFNVSTAGVITCWGVSAATFVSIDGIYPRDI